MARDGTHAFHGLTLACLVAADRYHHLATEIRPALAAGYMVICDRYLPSSLVLQRLDGVPTECVWSLHVHADRPDLTVILAGDPQLCQRRAARRGTYSRFHHGIVARSRHTGTWPPSWPWPATRPSPTTSATTLRNRSRTP